MRQAKKTETDQEILARLEKQLNALQDCVDGIAKVEEKWSGRRFCKLARAAAEKEIEVLIKKARFSPGSEEGLAKGCADTFVPVDRRNCGNQTDEFHAAATLVKATHHVGPIQVEPPPPPPPPPRLRPVNAPLSRGFNKALGVVDKVLQAPKAITNKDGTEALRAARAGSGMDAPSVSIPKRASKKKVGSAK